MQSKLLSLFSQGYNKIVLALVPGHRGVTGSELLDSATKSAAQHYPYPNIPIQLSLSYRTTLIWHHISTINKLQSIKKYLEPWH